MKNKTCSRCGNEFSRYRGMLCFDCVQSAKLKKLEYRFPLDDDPVRKAWYALSQRGERYITLEEYRKLCSVQKCTYCGFDLQHELAHPQVDHVVPVSRGGKNTSSNLVRTCRMCNMAKGSMTLQEFMVWLNHVRSGR